MKKHIPIWSYIFCACAPVFSQGPLHTVAQDTIVYKTIANACKPVGSRDLKLFKFSPITQNKSLPSIVFFFGGGWINGDPSAFFFQCNYLAQRGIICYSADYRIQSLDCTKPVSAVEDGKSAVRWLREHALSERIDPQKIFVGGGSAGGQVAAATGTIDALDNPKENLSISSVPNAMVLFNPVINTMKDGYSAGYTLIGDSLTALMISPVDHVTAKTPPTIIFVGTADVTAPMAGDFKFRSKMLALGHICEVDSFPGQVHGFFNTEPYRTQTIEAGYQFILKLQSVGIEPTPIGPQPSAMSHRLPPGTSSILYNILGRKRMVDPNRQDPTLEVHGVVNETGGVHSIVSVSNRN